jgi:urease accessory protein UreE
VDIGANVGNHSIFVSTVIGGAGVVAFEPGLKQHAIFSVNIALNEAKDSVRLYRCGLSDEARIVGDLADEIVTLKSGDDLLRDKEISFIKIDVEQYELAVLQCLEETLTKWPPKMLIEVGRSHEAAFHTRLTDLGYHVLERIDHGAHINALVAPNPQAAA